MDINIFISGVTFTIGAGTSAALGWVLFRRAMRVKRNGNGSKDTWLEDLRRRVTDLEIHRNNVQGRLVSVEAQTEQVMRHEEDISALERDVRLLRIERKRHP